MTFSIDDLNDAADIQVNESDFDTFVSADASGESVPENPAELPEYFRIKIPTRDDFMTIATIYNGQEDEHLERNEFTVRWLTDRNGEPYIFGSKEEARVFLALNVDSAFIRPTDRAQSIEAYAIREN